MNHNPTRPVIGWFICHDKITFAKIIPRISKQCLLEGISYDGASDLLFIPMPRCDSQRVACYHNSHGWPWEFFFCWAYHSASVWQMYTLELHFVGCKRSGLIKTARFNLSAAQYTWLLKNRFRMNSGQTKIRLTNRMLMWCLILVLLIYS